MNIHRIRLARHGLRFAAAGLIAAALAAGCAPVVDVRGNLPTEQRLGELQPGMQTRDDVARILGTPSTASAFGDPVWYYVGYRTETTAFLAPDETERQVVAVSFDERGFLEDVRRLGLEDGKPVEYVERETRTAGNELGILQQFLGNLGRFSGAGEGDAMSTRMPR